MGEEKQLIVSAYEGGELVGVYIAPGRRAASWARRANPNATLRALLSTLSGQVVADTREPDAYLKFWWDGERRACCVDLTDICEPWLADLKPEIIPLFRALASHTPDTANTSRKGDATT